LKVDVAAAERAHVRGFWSTRQHEEFVWARGPIAKTLPEFRVDRVAPERPQDPWVYATVGAWEATPDDDHGIEFVLLSPTESALHVELLAMVTNLHADRRYRLHLGSTIDIGRPWLDDSPADHLLVSLPYPFGPKLELCVVGERHIRYLWLVPITGAEAALARRDGVEALEALLDTDNVDVVDPNRVSVV
jgi:hypothetical protein